jgi:hypothetical protein
VTAAIVVVAVELLALAVLRQRFFHASFAASLASVTLGGALIVAISVALGSAAG